MADQPSGGSPPGKGPAIVIHTTQSDDHNLNGETAPNSASGAASTDTAVPEDIHDLNSLQLAVPGRDRSGSVFSIASTIASPSTIIQPQIVMSSDVRTVVDPLAPNIRSFHDYKVNPDHSNVFPLNPGQLGKMFHPKNLSAFWALGGLNGLEKGLRTDINTGLHPDEDKLDAGPSFTDAVSSSLEGHYKPLAGDTGVYLPDTIPGLDQHDVDSKPTGPPIPKWKFGMSKQEKTQRNKAKADKKAEIQRYEDSEALKKKLASLSPASVCKFNDGFSSRKHVFSDNHLPVRPSKSFLYLLWCAFKDKIIILLTIAAIVSLALGLYQTFGVVHKEGEPSIEWVEGVAIILAITIVVLVGSINDWQKERQFLKLNAKKENRQVIVCRGGTSITISIYDLMAGDIVNIATGDVLPADGIVVTAHNLQCDESSATGESDIMRKVTGYDALAAIKGNQDVSKIDPFILAGSKVSDGVGTFMVTCTGIFSEFGKITMGLNEDDEATPLQGKLDIMAEIIGKFALGAGAFLFIVLFIKFLAGLPKAGPDVTPDQKGQQFLNLFITAVTVVVVAVPEGLPLAVTLALAFATTRMLKQNNLVRVLKSCETMGNASTICSDKTGTLTQNRMTVVAGRFCTLDFDLKDKSTTDSNTTSDSEPVQTEKPTFTAAMGAPIKRLIVDSIVFNSTATKLMEDGKVVYNGSKTESALLEFGTGFFEMGDLDEERKREKPVHLFTFSSAQKCMGVVMDRGDAGYRILIKGASEILFAHCTHRIANLASTRDVPESKEISPAFKDGMDKYIKKLANVPLRTIALIYRDIPKPGKNEPPLSFEGADIKTFLPGSTLLGVVGIQDPLRDGVVDAVNDFKRAGVTVRMVTGDNMDTARAIAKECGIYQPGISTIMEGPRFRELTEAQLMEVVPNLHVLARSSPTDKQILVNCLKKLGEIVAVTGDGTNDAPALKAGHVGFSMGIAGTETAKEASDIILMDDNFGSIVTALLWGRAVNDSVKKFLQFQLSVNVTAVVLTFFTAVISSTQTSVLSAVQLLWVNLIMDTFAALALATDPPTRSLLNRKPESKTSSLITPTMAKMITLQSVYQLIITFTLQYAGRSILSYDDVEAEKLSTLIFNTFVWMQIFNQLNSRRLDNKLNIFEGILNNYYFLFINAIMIGGQVLIIYVGGAAFSVKHLNGTQWAISIILGAISLPIGVAIRFLPDFNFWIFKDKSSNLHDGRLAVDEPQEDFTRTGTGYDDSDNVTSHLNQHIRSRPRHRGNRLWHALGVRRDEKRSSQSTVSALALATNIVTPLAYNRGNTNKV